jgi:hypothetical protein
VVSNTVSSISISSSYGSGLDPIKIFSEDAECALDRYVDHGLLTVVA